MFSNAGGHGNVEHDLVTPGRAGGSPLRGIDASVAALRDHIGTATQILSDPWSHNIGGLNFERCV